AATAAINAVGCDLPDCQQWAEDLVGEIIDQVEDYVSDMATAQAVSDGWVLSLHPDIKVVPEPAGQFFPGSVQVTIQRPEGTSVANGKCNVEFGITGTGPVSWTDAKGTYHNQEVVSGTIFPSKNLWIEPAEIPSGGSKTVAISLIDFERHTYLPGASFFDFGSKAKADYHLRSLSLWRSVDTTYTMTVDVCGQVFVETFKMAFLPKNPSDFPTP
ncbi:MAG: hypothetical protein ACFCU2_13110, partial [Acidimicrobiia bacterium]